MVTQGIPAVVVNVYWTREETFMHSAILSLSHQREEWVCLIDKAHPYGYRSTSNGYCTSRKEETGFLPGKYIDIYFEHGADK